MERNNNLDVLRVIACIFVILIHVSCTYVDKYIGQNNSEFIIANIFDSFSRCAVPIFIVISGYLLLNDDRNSDYKYFYKKSFYKLGIPTITWSAIYFLFYESLEILKGKEKRNLLEPIYNWIQGSPASHMWYMYMIIGMYIITPILINLKNKNSDKFIKFGFVCMILDIALCKYNFIWLFRFIQYLGYFIFGYYISNIKNKNNSALYFTGWFVGSIVVCIGTYYLKNTSLYSYLSIPVVIASICITIGVLSLDINASMTNISKHTFNIYLVHLMIITILSKVLIYIGLDNYPFVFIPCASCIVFIVSLIISKNIYYLKNKIQIINFLF